MEDITVYEEAEKHEIEEETDRELRIAMPLINSPYLPGTAFKTVGGIKDKGMRDIALAEYYYFSGRSEKASDIAEEYLIHRDIALRLSACWLYAYANLALDRIPRSKQALAQILSVSAEIDENTPPLYRAFAVCIATGAKILLHSSSPAPVSGHEPHKTTHSYVAVGT